MKTISVRNRLARDLEQGKKVSYKDAFFTSERLGQSITPKEVREANSKLDVMIQELDKDKPRATTQEFLQRMVAYFWRIHDLSQDQASVLGFLASGGEDDKDNCEALPNSCSSPSKSCIPTN